MRFTAYMSEKPGDMVREAREKNRLSQTEFARRIGISQSHLSDVERGAKAVSRTVAMKLQKLFGLSAQALMEMPPEGASPDRIAYSLDTGTPMMVREATDDYLHIPILSARVAGGTPELIASERVTEHACIHRRAIRKHDPRVLVCTFVTGNSMEPVLRDGAVVCIDTTARPEGGKTPPGSIWAVRKGEGAVVKYLQIRDHTIVLVSENKAYPVELVKDPAAIIGRVIWAWQSFS